MEFQKQEAILKELLEDDYQPLITEHPPIQAPHEELQCSICYNMFNIPIVLPNCKHTFCRDCLDEWVGKQAMNCPLCRINVSNYLQNNQMKFSLIDFNTMFLIDNIEIKCQNCDWIGKTKDLIIHQEKYCNLIQCPYKCSKKLKKEQIDDHKQICPNRIINCPLYCGEEMQAHKIFEHMQNCNNSFTQCSNCQAVMQNIRMFTHKCKSLESKCRNHILGCNKEELHSQCEYEMNYCKECFDFVMQKDLKKHQCKQKQTLIDLLTKYKNVLIEALQPFKHSQQLYEKSILLCQKQSLLLSQIPSDQNNIITILQQFGPIQNLKQYLDLKNVQHKRVAIRYFDQMYTKSCQQYIQFQSSQLRTKNQMMKQVLVAELQTQDKNKIILQFKQFEIENVQFMQSKTDWKKGKMHYTFLLFFPSEEQAKKCQDANQTFKFYSEQQFEQKQQYCLNPYE